MIKCVLRRPWNFAGICGFCDSISTADKTDLLIDRETHSYYILCPVCKYRVAMSELTESMVDELIRNGVEPNELR